MYDKLIKEQKLLFKEKSFTIKQLYNADEVFVTSTASFVTPIIKVNNQQINKSKIGKITKKLSEIYYGEIVCG